MKNPPYLDKRFVPLAVALRSMLAETEAKILAAAPAERARLQERALVLRDWLRRSQQSPCQLSCALIQIDGPALAHRWSLTAASG